MADWRPGTHDVVSVIEADRGRHRTPRRDARQTAPRHARPGVSGLRQELLTRQSCRDALELELVILLGLVLDADHHPTCGDWRREMDGTTVRDPRDDVRSR